MQSKRVGSREFNSAQVRLWFTLGAMLFVAIALVSF
jgi:hypothetical protein